VTVQVSLSVQGLERVNELDQLIKIKVILRYKWNDPRLRWDPSKYGGLMNISTDMNYLNKSIWYPDLLLYELKSDLSL